jgi:PTS system cellobiose-specific IIB component
MSEAIIKAAILSTADNSSSLLAEKIRKAFEKIGRKIDFKVMDVNQISAWDYSKDHLDIILVAPQLKFMKTNIVQKAQPHGVIVQDIGTKEYGYMESEKIFSQMVKLLKLG